MSKGIKEAEATMGAKKLTSLRDMLGKDDSDTDDDKLAAELLNAEGKLIVDTTLPSGYQEEIMAQELLQHLANYARFTQAWRAARNGNDQARARQMFDQMKYSQLTAAIIERAYPNAKKLADELAEIQVRQIRKNRQAQQAQDGG